MSFFLVEDPESVDYKLKCCVHTEDGKYIEVPRELFRNHVTFMRRKVITSAPFDVPLPSEQMLLLLQQVEHNFAVSSKATTADEDKNSSTAAAEETNKRPKWMDSLTKRGNKFASLCLGSGGWDGSGVRFYENTMPQEGDTVWVRVTNVNDTSANVQLVEYGNIEGVIPYTEITRLRIRSIGKVIKVGRTEAAQVLRLDRDKGYIDLSKKIVSQDQSRLCEEKFHKGNEVRSIVCHLAEEFNLDPQKAMKQIAYPLYRKDPSKHAWDWLKELIDDDLAKVAARDALLAELELPESQRESLLNTIRHYMKKRIVTVRADLELTCNTSEGVEAIRDTLLFAQQHASSFKEPIIPYVVSIIAPPLYMIRARTEDGYEAERRMTDTINKMTYEFAVRNGELKLLKAPHILGDHVTKGTGGGDEDGDDEEL